MNPKPCLSPLQKLAAKWRVIGLLVVAYARLLRRCEDGRGQGGAPQAEQLYIAVRTAQVMLVREVTETLEAHPPQTEEDENALAYLRLSAMYLLAIALVIEDIMGRGELLGAAVWHGAGFGVDRQIISPTGTTYRFAILDPG